MNSPSGKQKTLEEAKNWLRTRLAERRHPLVSCDGERAAGVIERLTSLEGEHWGSTWGEVGAAFERTAEKVEAEGKTDVAAEAHFQAYAFYFVGRYPCPDHPTKEACARKAREHFVMASQSFHPPVERITIPFTGRQGEAAGIITYLQKPEGMACPPVVVSWGGVDSYKEEQYANGRHIVGAGMASLAVDMPGTGESPVIGSTDAERQFAPVFEWIRRRSDLDGSRIAVTGSSFGGYWATKVAHTYREYFRGAVNWGGGVHYNFETDWLETSRYAESALMDLGMTRAHAFGCSVYEDYVSLAPNLSLLRQGLLDQPCAPLLLINGREDRQVPLQDFYLLLEHGDPKTIRLFPGGHMGRTPSTLPTIVRWLTDRFRIPG